MVDLETARYETGVDPYIDVVTAQNGLLADRQTLATLHTQAMTASVQLIEALGGGWDSTQLPTPQQVSKKITPAESTSRGRGRRLYPRSSRIEASTREQMRGFFPFTSFR